MIVWSQHYSTGKFRKKKCRNSIRIFFYDYYWHIYPPIPRKRRSAVRARLGVAGHLTTTLRWGIPLSAFPNGTTSKLAGFLHIVPSMLNVKQGSYEYQFSSHWFNPTRNRTPSVPIQKQTLYTTRSSDRFPVTEFLVTKSS